MTESERPEALFPFNERSLSTLLRALTLSEGNFALILVRCNYHIGRLQMWQQLQARYSQPLQELVLPKSTTTLFTTIVAAIDEPPSALLVFGLESVSNVDQLLVSSNQVRDEFRKRFSFPLVIWVTDEILQKLTRFAPDFKSFAAASIKFELTTAQLVTLWQQRINDLFNAIFEAGMEEFLPNKVLGLAPGCRYRQELESALRDLQARNVRLEPEMVATWKFIRGRDAYGSNNLDEALKLYQQSLAALPSGVAANSSPLPDPNLTRRGVIFHHSVLCYCRKAELQPLENRDNWAQARASVEAGLAVFQAAGRLDLAAGLMLQLCEILCHLESWQELQTLALQVLTQPQIYRPIQLAQASGFLAQVALAQQNWQGARQLAETAMQILKQSRLDQPEQQGLYLLMLAKAQRQLNHPRLAIAYLEQAKAIEMVPTGAPRQRPHLYLDILEELRSLYFEQQQYLQAFEIRATQRSIEQQYGFSTFLGTVSLQPLRVPSSSPTDRAVSRLPREIAAAGRQPDVQHLITRLSRTDHKLTILHGSSGVGKSSLLNAGLVPALSAHIINARSVLPIVQKVYRGWLQACGRALTDALQTFPEVPCLLTPPFSHSEIIQQLRHNAEHNLLSVLIFDQFEEFFFVYTNLADRCKFYEFLRDCLNLPFVKVILSLREDYLHYLLECERYCPIDAINNNILDGQIRYHLGELSLKDATNVIRTLAASQYQLEDALIDALVKDLAGSSSSVRLIELQVVGAQLQAEKIHRLTQYRALGENPKTRLVERSLLSVIDDCGPENAALVWKVLFSLTDERGTRPLKTRTDLYQLIDSGEGRSPEKRTPRRREFSRNSSAKGSTVLVDRKSSEAVSPDSALELILKILVGSGLVFRLPDEPQDRYQLVHDYLVAPIRQTYQRRVQRAIAAQLKSQDMALLRVRRQHLYAVTVGVTMAILAAAVGGLAWRTEMQKRFTSNLLTNAQLTGLSASSEALFASHKEFDALLEATRAAKRLQEATTVEPYTRLQVLTAFEQAVYGVKERNRLEGHSDVVWNVSFSKDGQAIASASRDKTIRLWRPDGTLFNVLKGHEESVTSAVFSPNGQLLASGSWDRTVRIWHLDGTGVQVLRGHKGYVYDVSFSPNGRWIASASGDGTIKLWTSEGKLVKTWFAHQGIVTSVSFSPDSQRLASASEDKTVKLWTLKGHRLQTLTGHHGKISAVKFSPDGQRLASASDDRTVKLWKTDSKGVTRLERTLSGHQGWVFDVAFSPDGKAIASASDDNTVKLWHNDGKLVKTFDGHSDGVTGVSFSPDGQVLASASFDKTIKLWGRYDQSRLILRGHHDEVRSVAISRDGQLIASAGNDKTIKLWTRTGKLLATLQGHTERIYSVVFSPDSQYLASASRDGTVRIWQRDGTLIKTLQGHKDWVLDVSFSADSQYLASASRDHTIKLWRRDGQLIKTLKGHSDRVNAVSFSPDGQYLASASDDNTVKLWTADGTLLKTLKGHSNWVLDVNFSPDSQRLASASYDNTVKIWNRDGIELKTLKGHSDSVAKVRFSPSGQILATTSWDNRVQLWRLDDTLVKTLEAHKARVIGISWSNDAQTLVSGSQDHTVIVWNWNLDQLLSKSCYWLEDYLQTNPKVRPSDRYLCTQIDGGKKTEN
jgi:WD40 repeat protein